MGVTIDEHIIKKLVWYLNLVTQNYILSGLVKTSSVRVKHTIKVLLFQVVTS